jgi:uncharacterized protein
MLPRRIDPRKLTAQGATLSGCIPTAQLQRLMAAVLDADAGVEVTLDFGRDAQGNAVVEGEFTLDADLRCQRCLGVVRQRLSSGCRLGIVWDDQQARQLPRDLEPWVVPEQDADLFELAEDEVLLALPIVPRHDADACRATGRYSTGGFDDTGEADEGNPFRILEQLKKND